MLKIKDAKFYLDDKEFQIRSGAIHYFRVPKIYWQDRLEKLKNCGLNTVETYVAWVFHEEEEGKFNFTNERNLKEFVDIAKKLGLNVILRPGPFICAEYDFGGFPYWLLKDRNIKLRTYDEKYLFYTKRFFDNLFKHLKGCFSSEGGNIIAVQVENEYGSFGNSKDYLDELTKIIKELGIKELLFTSDGTWNNMLSGGIIDGVLPTLNMGIGELNKKFESLKPFRDNVPFMCSEYWCGWFTRWGQKKIKKNIKQIALDIKYFLENNVSFNLYMFHGGTNFGFDAGANYQRYFTPTTTSYDYLAPLSEDGTMTELYHLIRKTIFEFDNRELTKLEDKKENQEIKEVILNEKANLFKNLDLISNSHYSKSIKNMEDLNQRHGLILYSKVIKGEYSTSIITLEDVHDNSYVYINNKLRKKFYRIANQKGKLLPNKRKSTFKFIMPAFKGEMKIDILVESYGRVNYGKNIYDRKGIKNIFIADQYIYGWDIKTIPLNNLEKLKFEKLDDINNLDYPTFLKGSFNADTNKDTFLVLKDFYKGNIFINGFNVGRFNKIGPQEKYYVPKNILKEKNEIIILETEKAKSNIVNFVK